MALKQWHTWKIVQKPLSQCYGTFSMHTLEKALNKNIFKNHTCCLSCSGLPLFLLLGRNCPKIYIKSSSLGTKVMIATEKKKVSSVYRCHLLPELRRVRLFWTLALLWQVMCLFKFLLRATGSRHFPESISFEINKSRIIKIRKRKNGDSCPNSNFFV